MEITRRFVFKGYASALSGQILRPQEQHHRRRLRVERPRCNRWPLAIRDEGLNHSATRSQVGLGEHARRRVSSTMRSGQSRRQPQSPSGRADIDDDGHRGSVRELSVGNNQGPFFTAKRLRATLVSRSPEGSGEPRIAPEKDTVIEGVSIDGHGLAVTLNLPLFQTYDTRSKLVAAADDPKLAKSAGETW